MRAHASARAARVGAETRLVELRSDPPLVLRATPAGLHLVGGAGGPLGGDELALEGIDPFRGGWRLCGLLGERRTRGYSDAGNAG